ncbi:kinesin-like protein KIN-14I isoform X1 [Capsicum galapagoense]
MALVSHMQSSKNGLSLPATIFNMVTKSTTSYETSPASFMDDSRLLEDLQEKQKQKLEMQKELDRLNDNLTFEKQNLEVADCDCDIFRSLYNEKNAELQVALTEKRNLELRFS